MTLILSYLSRQGIVQAADRKISYGGGKEPDAVRKSVVCPTAGAVFTISYTGVPAHFLDPQSQVPIPFEEWLCRQIALAPQLDSPPEVARLLSHKLEQDIGPSRRHFGLSQSNSPFSVVFAGVHGRQPFFACPTNFEDFATRFHLGTETTIPFAPKARVHFVSRGEFNGWVVPYAGTGYCLLGNGATTSLSPRVVKSLLRLLDRNFTRGGGLSSVARLLGWGVEKAAATTSTVSSESISVSIPVGEGPVVTEQHARRRAQLTMPRICGPSGQSTVLFGPPSADTPAAATLTRDANLTPQVYGVFVRFDEEAHYWTRYLCDDREVFDAWIDLIRDWEIAQFCGLTTVGHLRDTLANAHGWGERVLSNLLDLEGSGGIGEVHAHARHTAVTALVAAAHAELLLASPSVACGFSQEFLKNAITEKRAQ